MLLPAERLRMNFILALRFTYLITGSKWVGTFLVRFCSCLCFSYLLLLLSSHWVVSDSAVPWTVACQASLSFTISWSLVRLTSIELMLPSNHLILCHLHWGQEEKGATDGEIVLPLKNKLLLMLCCALLFSFFLFPELVCISTDM